ncbi:MAG TPA: family 43 glycosylhydrolase [Gemmatimonadales bacterium]|nr:family 43 glycosylhydrolase [Gemmatimonadales bacterium]
MTEPPPRARHGCRCAGLVLLALLGASPATPQSPGLRTYCNPLDIEYRYSLKQLDSKISYRAGADPVVVNHRGEYYLFVTNSGGWWHSTDLGQWRFVTPDRWLEGDINAPAAMSVRDTLYLFPSAFEPAPVFFTTTPENGHLELFNPLMPELPGAQGPWDPDVFHDPDTDRWYLYFGSSNLYPIYGIELDQRRRLAYIARARDLLHLNPALHGWERFGQDHRDTIKPFIEGATMTKYHGKYYLQYAAPGTEYNVYANGTYVGDQPLGPFSYAPYNPIAYKPGGFVHGAGHGNTFRDNFGNYWNTGTPWVAVNWNFERRVAMFPAGFDADDELFVNTRFGDFPHYLPTERWADRNALFTGWMLLSYRKPATASSVQDTFPATNVTDENPRTFWVARTNSADQWLTIDLQRVFDVKALQVNYTDYQSNVFVNDSTVYTRFRMRGSADGITWRLLADLSRETRDRPNAYIELPVPVRARYIRYEHGYVASPNLAISDIRIFGNGRASPPATPAGLAVRRDTDPRNAFITWKGVPGAVGYNILWGIAKTKLYQTYQVFANQSEALELRALTVGQSYHFAIEAFNEDGVSRPSDTVGLR